uniref:Secreted protein n=1 Tax=Anopheles darlingi TaxID=43151 RepID=A0A2M4DEN5_ANODA
MFLGQLLCLNHLFIYLEETGGGTSDVLGMYSLPHHPSSVFHIFFCVRLILSVNQRHNFEMDNRLNYLFLFMCMYWFFTPLLN